MEYSMISCCFLPDKNNTLDNDTQECWIVGEVSGRVVVLVVAYLGVSSC